MTHERTGMSDYLTYFFHSRCWMPPHLRSNDTSNIRMRRVKAPCTPAFLCSMRRFQRGFTSFYHIRRPPGPVPSVLFIDK